MHIKMDVKLIGILLSLSCFQQSIAAEGPLPIHLSISESILHTNNATRSSIKNLQESETQWTTAANLNAIFDKSENLLANIDYRWFQTEYSKDSQQKRPRLTGTATISTGGVSEFYRLGLNHTSNQLLIDPTLSNVSSNLENRNTITGFLTLKTRQEKPNRLELTTSQTYIQFDELEQNNTARTKAELLYTRKLSPLNNGGMNLAFTEVSYPELVTADTDFTMSTLFGYFQRKLRLWNYYFALGISQSRSATSDDDNPYGQLNLEYLPGGISTLLLSISTEMTDSSQNNTTLTQNAASLQQENQASSVQAEANTDGSFLVRDQIQRDTISLRYNSNSLCTKCTLRIQVLYESDDYLNTKSENSIELMSRAGLTYQVSRAVSLSLNLTHSSFEFTERQNPNNYNQNSAQLAWAWQGVSSFRVSIFAGALERNNEDVGSYSAYEGGVNLSYQIM